ncbi:MAG: T9SS type A sorting domain-containing protein [Sphingobacteriales bacterium]|nr:MAG: T9SS type A sorting domain-containing protein [Sphingobacteriales bacterium]
MKNISIFVVLIVYGLIVVGQPKYFEKSISWGWVQGSNKVYFTSDTSIVFSCGSIATNTTLEKVNLLFTDQFAENQTLLTYGEEFGSFVILDLITTPFGYAFCGWMNNEPYETLPWDIYSYPYIMEVNHAGEVINHYQLPDPPYEGNGSALLYYPETNTYYLGGNAFTTAAEPDRLVMTKITDGEIVWRKYYDSFMKRNRIFDLLPTSDGGCFALGVVNYSSASIYEGEVLLMRINPEGNLILSKTFKWNWLKAGGFRLNRFNEDNLIITGFSKNNNALLLRTDTLGNIMWDRHYEFGNNFNETVNAFQLGDNIVCAGSRRHTGGKVEAFLMKVRGSDGEPLWVRYFDAEPNNDYFYDFTPAPDGGFLCVGRTEPVGAANVLVVKTNCMGLLSLPQADFTFVQDTTPPALFTFFNQSQYVYPDSIDGGHFIWEFGDGAVSNSTHPTHIYPEEGHYLVTLTAIVCSDTSVTQQLVYARSGSGIAVGIPDSSWEGSGGSSILVYPNPAQNTLTFALPEGLTPPSGGWGVEGDLGVSIYNLTGQMVLQTTLAAGETNKTISVAHLPEGVYLYSVEQSGSVLARGKVAVVR